MLRTATSRAASIGRGALVSVHACAIPAPIATLAATRCEREVEPARAHIPTHAIAGPAISSGRRPARSASIAAGTLHSSRASGVDAVITPRSDVLSSRAADLTPRAALRVSKSPAEELGLLDPEVDDETLLAAMVAHPVLVNRPIVCTHKGVRLCRPSEEVFDLLDRLPPGPFHKEDGEMLIDAAGRRVGG